jgi:hypothetical protein
LKVGVGEAAERAARTLVAGLLPERAAAAPITPPNTRAAATTDPKRMIRVLSMPASSGPNLKTSLDSGVSFGFVEGLDGPGDAAALAGEAHPAVEPSRGPAEVTAGGATAGSRNFRGSRG